jgi:hypothetical protein
MLGNFDTSTKLDTTFDVDGAAANEDVQETSAKFEVPGVEAELGLSVSSVDNIGFDFFIKSRTLGPFLFDISDMDIST